MHEVSSNNHQNKSEMRIVTMATRKKTIQLPTKCFQHPFKVIAHSSFYRSQIFTVYYNANFDLDQKSMSSGGCGEIISLCYILAGLTSNLGMVRLRRRTALTDSPFTISARQQYPEEIER